jgi:hypothetical protein
VPIVPSAVIPPGDMTVSYDSRFDRIFHPCWIPFFLSRKFRMNRQTGNWLVDASGKPIHLTNTQLDMINHQIGGLQQEQDRYAFEVRNRLSRIRTPTSQDEEKIRLHTQATFHFEHDEDGFFEAVERGDYEGDTIMDEIVAWEKRENVQVDWGKGEIIVKTEKIREQFGVDLKSMKGKGTDDDPIVID